MQPVIFLEKVRPPEPRGLVRERLISAITPRSHPPATSALVVGPAGSGKTTLLSQLAATCGPVGWYRAGREESDEPAVTGYLGHALANALGDPNLAVAASKGEIRELIRALEEAGPRAATLFIDDLQELAGTAGEQAADTLLTMRPRELVVILGSRRPPGFNTSRLIVAGDMLELTQDDLRFRSWEVEQLFRNVYEAHLSPEASAALARRTGGWAAGLHLFHLATAHCSRSERERAIGDLGGRSRLIRSYLARNVLDGLPAGRLDFLVRTSALGDLTGELCDALLNATGSAAILEALEYEQLFTSSTDGGVTYRYHHVLQTELEGMLVDRLGGHGARALYRAAAQLLERDARLGAAARAYARAEEWGSVARLLTTAPSMTGADPLPGLAALPGVPSDDPALTVAEARLLARRGQLTASIDAYHRAESLLEDRSFVARCRRERRTLELWLPGSTRPPASALTDLEPVVVELRELTRSATAVPTTPLARGLHLVLTGRLGDAVAALSRAGLADDGPGLAARLTAQFVPLLQGHLDPDTGPIEAVALDADMDGWVWLARVAHGVLLARLVAEAPDEWADSAREVIDGFKHLDDPWTELLTSIALAAGFARGGRPGPAADAFGRAAELTERLAAPALTHWVGRLAANSDTPVPEAGPGVAPAPAPAAEVRAAAPVALTCLGGFSLTVSGHEVDSIHLRPRARALLMLLALNHQRPVHRERLIEQLWPGSSLASGLRCLQVAVSSIRQWLADAGLDKRSLAREGDAYALRLAGADDRLRSFEQLAGTAARAGDRRSALGLAQAALALYTGDLLPETGPAEWVVDERDRLRRLAAVTAATAARDALHLGDHRTALDDAYRAVSLDPFQDAAWHVIVDCNSALGDHAAAAAARRRQSRVMAELGLGG